MDDFAEITVSGEQRLDFLRRFLPFEHGTPSHDALNDVMNAIDPEPFKTCFTQWVEAMRDADPEVIAVDGKTARRTHEGRRGRTPLHLVSAWASRQRLVLGQEAVADKSNEITAIPLLLDRLVLTGALVTIDAMGTQDKVAETIVGKGVDYLLALKGNHPVLAEDVARFFENPPDEMVEFFETTDADHGRIENRRHLVCHDVSWLFSDRRYTDEPRFPLLDARAFARAVRAHWGIENRLHWVLDVVYHDDLVRLRTGHGPQNMGIIKHMAINIVRRPNDKHSLKVRRKLAALNSDYLAALIGHAPQSLRSDSPETRGTATVRSQEPSPSPASPASPPSPLSSRAFISVANWNQNRSAPA
jgi:predicted transposase YbfD/YdcC